MVYPNGYMMTQIRNTEPNKAKYMKKATIAALVGLAATMLFSGCLLIQLGGGSTTKPQTPTVGQQLTDLKKAKDAGALTDAEYQAQRAKLLDQK
jgi:hypothetical protein